MANHLWAGAGLLAAAGACFFGCSTDESIGRSTQPLNSSPVLGNFVLYAQQTVNLGSHDKVSGGDIGVVSTALTSFGPQMVASDHVSVDPTHNILAPSVLLGSHSAVGDIQTNALTNSGATYGVLAAFPTAMPPLPLAVTSTAGSDITVAEHAAMTLTPGAYGVLTVESHATVTLQAGTYSFTTAAIADHVQLTAAAGGVTIQIAGALSVDVNTNIAPVNGQTASALNISVSGNDGITAPAISLGSHDQIVALIAAPHGTLSIADHVQATGAFAAFAIVIGEQAQLTYQSGFSIPTGPPRQVVAGNTLPAAEASAPILGPLPQTAVLNLALELPLQNADALASLLQALYDPTNPQYQQFLSPSAFYAQFASASLYQQLVIWAQSQGLQTTTFANSRLLVVTGAVSILESVFGLAFNLYGDLSGGEFFAPDRVPTIPSSVPGLFNAAGFNNFNTPGNAPPTSGAAIASGSGPNGSFYGPDFRNLYATGTSLDGTGQSLALVEFDDFVDNDISVYANLSTSPLTIPPITRIPVMGGVVPSLGGSGAPGEVTLDIDMAMAMAPGLTNIFVFEGPPLRHFIPMQPFPVQNFSAYDASAAAIFNSIEGSIANQVSCSWLEFDGRGIVQSLVTMSMVGQSVFFASGDNGAYVASNPVFGLRGGCPSLNPDCFYPGAPLPMDPFNSPGLVLGSQGGQCVVGTGPCVEAVNFMTVVGGTQAAPSVTGSAPHTGCLTEAVWNNGDELAFKEPNAGPSSGGVCPNATSPAFQPAALMTLANSFGANASTISRNIPDVAALATGIWTVNSGLGFSSGGTSAAAPLWAGLMALINQLRAGAGLNPIGLANQLLYAVGQSSNYNSDFLDIIGGTINPNLGDTAHWTAVQGYDLATGWGSPRIGLFADLAATIPPPIGKFPAATVTVLTGKDDLRCTSLATLDLLDSFENVLGTLTLHKAGQPSWPANAFYPITIGPDGLTPPLALEQISFVRLNLIQTGNLCQIFTTSDNWDVAALEVQLVPLVGAPVVILDQSFNPQLRLMDHGNGTPWSVVFPVIHTLASCPLTCAPGPSCLTQMDCPSGTGTCLAGATGSGCCTVPSTVCNSNADCPSGTTCYTGSGTPGTCI